MSRPHCPCSQPHPTTVPVMAPRPSLQDCFGTLGSSPCRSDLLFCIVQGLSVPHCLVLTEIVAFFPPLSKRINRVWSLLREAWAPLQAAGARVTHSSRKKKSTREFICSEAGDKEAPLLFMGRSMRQSNLAEARPFPVRPSASGRELFLTKAVILWVTGSCPCHR